MNSDTEDTFIGKLLVEMKSNFNKSPPSRTEYSSDKFVKQNTHQEVVAKTPNSEDKIVIKSYKNDKNAEDKKISYVKIEENIKIFKRVKSSEGEPAKRLKVSSQVNNSEEKAQTHCTSPFHKEKEAEDTPKHDGENLPEFEYKLSEQKISKTIKCIETISDKISNKIVHVESDKIKEMEKEVKNTVSPGRRSLRLKSVVPEITKRKDNFDVPNVKRSPRRRSKDFSESVLANAIARKEKSYESADPPLQQRLSRRIKPTAKILANRELRLGIEMQNDARSSLSNDMVKKKIQNISPDVPKISKHHKSDSCLKISTEIINNSECNNGISENLTKSNLKQMQEKHLGILGLRAVGKSCEEESLKSESNTSTNSSVSNSPSEKNLSSSSTETNTIFKRNLRDRSRKQVENISENSPLTTNREHPKKIFKKSDICHSNNSLAEDNENKLIDDDYKQEAKKIKKSMKDHDDIVSTKPCSSNVTKSFIGKKVLYSCHCHLLNNVYVSLENRIGNIYCGAVDSIDGRFIGCTNAILENGTAVENKKDAMLLRASPRLPYILMCSNHSARLARHICCAGCGAFCTQGNFVQCAGRHLYHRECSIIKGHSSCPHCGIDSPNHDIQVLIRQNLNTVFLPTQDDSLKSARMSFSNDNADKTDQNFGRPDTPPILSSEIISMLANMNDIKNESAQFTVKDLYKAVKTNDHEKLVMVLASEVDVNSIVKESTRTTALHEASELGYLGVVHILVVSGAELDILDKMQKTPLISALLSDQLETLQYLIKAGSDLALKGPDGMTALHLAARDGNLEACRLLVTSPRTSASHIDALDEGGWTPLVWAAEHGHAIVIRYLLERNADPFVLDGLQNVALHWAALSGNSNITEMLLDRGCDVNSMNSHGDTPLHIAARYGKYRCALSLITRGADVTCLNRAGETPLDSCEVVDGDCYNLIKVNARLKKKLPNNDRGIILTNDISRGKESNPIQCVNSIDSVGEPTDFTYVTNVYATSADVRIDAALHSLTSCDCRERCPQSGSDCACTVLSTRCCYDEEGRLTADVDMDDPPMIFECNECCGCNKIMCTNRVVQRGITSRLELFRTANCGWSVKTLKDIRKGSFVSEYMGEILTDSDAKRREIDSYLFDIYNSPDESYCLDGFRYGNISRFINHMCTANLTPIRVFTDHQDIRFPRIALFANRDIEAGEVLGFDYGEKFWIAKHVEFPCVCGSEFCRYFNPLEITTSENGEKKENPAMTKSP